MRRPASGGFILLPLMLLPLAVPFGVAYSAWTGQRAQISAWDVQGPACPTSKWPLGGTPSHPPHSFDYAGARFARRGGDVSCAVIKRGAWWSRAEAHVCQFSAPVVLSYRYGATFAVVAPGMGRTATVKIADGRISCVVGGGFQG